jgi:hypothetical protein
MAPFTHSTLTNVIKTHVTTIWSRWKQSKPNNREGSVRFSLQSPAWLIKPPSDSIFVTRSCKDLDTDVQYSLQKIPTSWKLWVNLFLCKSRGNFNYFSLYCLLLTNEREEDNILYAWLMEIRASTV